MSLLKQLSNIGSTPSKLIIITDFGALLLVLLLFLTSLIIIVLLQHLLILPGEALLVAVREHLASLHRLFHVLTVVVHVEHVLAQGFLGANCSRDVL